MTPTIVARSATMQKVMDVVRRAAPTDASIVLWGEGCVGREFMARRIREMSGRARGPWMAINFAAIPAFMERPGLFGAPPGPDSPGRTPGLLERAAGGTLFLDEVAEMSPENQAELLRVLRAGRYRPPGAADDVVLDVRLIATTYDPERAIADGILRRDLYEHLSEVSLELPPLRWRREDIPALAGQFLRDAWEAGDRRDQPPPRLSPEAVRALVEHPWPGGLRELELVVDIAVWDAAPGHPIGLAELPGIVQAGVVRG